MVTMVTIETKVPQSVKDVLERYDINSLITRTIPDNYSMPSVSLEIYKTKTKFSIPVTLEMNDETVSRLEAYSSNHPDYSRTEILSYLIENVCDLSKIHTKDISKALNRYYEIAATNPDLHTDILEEYSNSLYYSFNTGLTEESLAYFLISSERTRIIKIKKSGPGPIQAPVLFIYI